MTDDEVPRREPKPAGAVSANNPCPFLRALVAGDYLSDGVERLSTIADTIVEASGGKSSEGSLPRAPVYLVALVANGLRPMHLVRSIRVGARLDELRNGPLDKRGAGSRVLDPAGRIDETELARLDQFSSDKTDAAGAVSRGLGAQELRVMMDANFARAKGKRRRIDRALMNGEWPVLLRVMGKPSAEGRHLSLTELRALFVDRRLPERITARLETRRFHRL